MPENHFTEEERKDLLRFDDAHSTSTSHSIDLSKIQEVLLSGKQPDLVLSEFMKRSADLIVSIEDHSSILADKVEEHLDLTEQAEAEAEYQQELEAPPQRVITERELLARAAAVLRGEASSASSTSAAPSKMPYIPPDLPFSIPTLSGISNAFGSAFRSLVPGSNFSGQPSSPPSPF